MCTHEQTFLFTLTHILSKNIFGAYIFLVKKMACNTLPSRSFCISFSVLSVPRTNVDVGSSGLGLLHCKEIYSILQILTPSGQKDLTQRRTFFIPTFCTLKTDPRHFKLKNINTPKIICSLYQDYTKC